jgi:hypothetical protein
MSEPKDKPSSKSPLPNPSGKQSSAETTLQANIPGIIIESTALSIQSPTKRKRQRSLRSTTQRRTKNTLLNPTERKKPKNRPSLRRPSYSRRAADYARVPAKRIE